MPSAQKILPGSEAQHLAAAVSQLQAQNAIARLWKKDPTVFTDDASAYPSILNRLGWLDVPGRMLSRTAEITSFAKEIRKAGFTHAVLLGMGGSSLFAEVLCQIFGKSADGLELHVLDSTDPSAVLAAAARLPAPTTLAIVSSKSGTTSEVSALSKFFWDWFQKADGKPAEHCVAITDAGTPLEKQAKEQSFRRSFVLDKTLGSDVGGRFSALTYFGLVPAALMGIDIDRLLRAGIGMYKKCGPDAPAAENPALALGVFLASLSQAGRDKLTFLCKPPMTAFGIWAEQLIAESTGKLGNGVLPVVGEPLWKPSGYGNDRVFVELQWADKPDAAISRHADALSKAGHPVARIQWSEAYDLGEEAAKWCVTTAVAGIALRVNPFDEPNVWETKDQTKVILSDYAKNRSLPQETATVAEKGVALYIPSMTSFTTMTDSLRSFVQGVKDGDFTAILSFLPQVPETDALLEKLRKLLGRNGRIPTVVEIGPRYLHSTGQLYKGGPDRGAFMVLTADDPVDAPIPGEAFSFSVLKRAQALGDYEALRKKGRRLLRIHLAKPFEASAKHLANRLEAALT